jgi:hypothetical protein
VKFIAEQLEIAFNGEMKSYGGKRKGAGRPRSGKFSRTFFVNDTEHKELSKYLGLLRTAAATASTRKAELGKLAGKGSR